MIQKILVVLVSFSLVAPEPIWAVAAERPRAHGARMDSVGTEALMPRLVVCAWSPMASVVRVEYLRWVSHLRQKLPKSFAQATPVPFLAFGLPSPSGKSSTVLFAALIILGCAVPALHAQSFFPQLSETAYANMFAFHMKYGVRWHLITLVWYFVPDRDPHDHSSRFINMIIIFTLAGAALSAMGTAVVGSWPGVDHLVRDVVLFFANHSTILLVLDEALLILVGMALWQQWNAKKWSRVMMEAHSLDHVLHKFTFSRLDSVFNFSVLIYSLFMMGMQFLYYLPAWALVTWVMYEVDRQWLTYLIRKHVRDDLGPVSAISLRYFPRIRLVLWENEPDALKWGGHFLFAALIAPLGTWKPLHSRLTDRIRGLYRVGHLTPAHAPAGQSLQLVNSAA